MSYYSQKQRRSFSSVGLNEIQNTKLPISRSRKHSSSQDPNSFRSLNTQEEFYKTRMRALQESGIRLENKILGLKEKTDLNKLSKESLKSLSQKWRKELKAKKDGSVYRKDLKFSKKSKKSLDCSRIKPEPLSRVERRLYRNRVKKWRESRGVNTDTLVKVSKREYLQYYPAFDKFQNLSQFRLHGNLSKIAKSLNISANEKELRRLCDLMDSDGDNKVVFGEYVLALQKMKKHDKEAFVGGKNGLTLDLMLMAYHRREKLNDVMNNFQVTPAERYHFASLYVRKRDNFVSRDRTAFFPCSLCNEEFEYTSELEAHKLEVHEYKGKYHTCFFCGETWIPNTSRKRHEATHRVEEEIGNKEGFKCRHCQAVFSSRDILAFHIRSKHTPLKLDVLECVNCSDTFFTPQEREQHIKEFHSYKPVRGKRKNKQQTKPNLAVIEEESEEEESEDMDMTPEEYNNMQDAYLHSRGRRNAHMLLGKVHMLRQVTEFRDTHDHKNVAELQNQFHQQEEEAREREAQSLANQKRGDMFEFTLF